MEHEDSETLLSYYVYVLIDPNDDKVFYVGKGTGNRANDHEREALRSDAREKGKLKRINEIKAKKCEPKVLVIGRYETEPEAFAVEATLIKWVYGIGDLTNEVQGHRHNSVRQKGCMEKISGIDIPLRPKGLYDGTYINEKRQEIVNNSVEEKLSRLKESLCDYGIITSPPDTSKPLDPCIWIDNFYSGIRVQVKLQLSGENVVVNLRPSKETSVDTFEKFVSKVGLAIKGKGRDQYAPIADFKTKSGYPRGYKLDDIDTIANALEETRARMNKPKT